MRILKGDAIAQEDYSCAYCNTSIQAGTAYTTIANIIRDEDKETIINQKVHTQCYEIAVVLYLLEREEPLYHPEFILEIEAIAQAFNLVEGYKYLSFFDTVYAVYGALKEDILYMKQLQQDKKEDT